MGSSLHTLQYYSASCLHSPTRRDAEEKMKYNVKRKKREQRKRQAEEKRILRTILEKALAGDAHMQWCMGMAYEKGWYGVKQRNNKAVNWYSRAAARGHAMAEGKLGNFYLWGGGGVIKDNKKAVNMWQRAAEHGDVPSMRNLGCCYFEGDGIEIDAKRGMEWLQRAATMDDECSMLEMCKYAPDTNKVGNVLRHCNGLTQPTAMCTLGRMYDNAEGGLLQNEVEAFKWYEKAARMGDLTAQWTLFVCYEYGEGVTKDKNKALKWLQVAAKGGDIEAQTALGEKYYDGEGVGLDVNEAKRLFTLAAKQGDADAQFQLGRIESDTTAGIFWYMKAAAQDHTTAMWNLLTKAALAENEDAQRILSGMYVRGVRTAFDVKAADDWILKYNQP